MPRRSILTDRQRAALFDLPTDEVSMLRHYTLADDDLEIIHARRRPHNRFGFALQLCAPRYPGRFGPVAVWCRSCDSVMCSKGDDSWAQEEQTNFAKMGLSQQRYVMRHRIMPAL